MLDRYPIPEFLRQPNFDEDEEMHPMLIGIHGKKRSGKDTVGKRVAQFFGEERVQLIAFADAMKSICAIAYDIPIERFYDDAQKEMSVGPQLSPRQAMTTMHNALIPFLGQHIFVDVVRAAWGRAQVSGRILVVTDVRFEWEADFIRSNFGVLIHIARPETDIHAGGHVSEQGIEFDPADDFLITNSGTLEELHSKVVNICTAIVDINR